MRGSRITSVNRRAKSIVVALQSHFLVVTPRFTGALLLTEPADDRYTCLHLALADGSWLVVASAMGQDADPAWLHNLRADPRAHVLLPGREVDVLASVLGPREAAQRWPSLVRTIPQLRTYARRTTRDIPVVRLTPR